MRLPVVSMERVRDELRSTFWLVPALCVCLAIALAIGLVALDGALPGLDSGFLFPGPPDGARTFLSSIVTAMISFTGLVFSITILVLQLTSGQFSPRVLRMFLRDGTSQITLGVFVATFVYAMVVQRAVVGDEASGPAVPRIAVTGAFIFVLTSVGLFIRYIGHIANLVRVATIIDTIARESRALLDEHYPVESPAGPVEAGRHAGLIGSVPVGQVVTSTIGAPRPGVLVSVNEQALAALAGREDCLLELAVLIGDYVPGDGPLFVVHGEPVDRDRLVRSACDLVAMDTERTMEQDLAFGFRQLVDIAERALSPSVNDPTTACQSTDALHDLLRRLAGRPDRSDQVLDESGRLRLIVPRYRFADLLDLTVGEIWRYGHEAAQVPERIARMLADLSSVARPEHRGGIERWRRVVGSRPASPGGDAGTGSSS